MTEAATPDARLRDAIANQDVVIFMKGVRRAPQCGFSARAVDLLDRHLDHYASVDVLADPELRDAVKSFTSWPTIPQVFVRGEFVGGTDILAEMEQTGELVQVLGDLAVAAKAPAVTITAGAVAAVRSALADADPGDGLRLLIDSRFHNDLSIGPKEAGDLETASGGLTLWLDPASARRAQGITIDYVVTPQGAGFRIDNPAAPAGVRPLSVRELQRKLEAGDDLELVDVRTVEEQARASLAGARLLDDGLMQELVALPKDTPLVFLCHHGGRSARAAQHFIDLGFQEVYDVSGGIDAWSREIDPSVPRY